MKHPARFGIFFEDLADVHFFVDPPLDFPHEFLLFPSVFPPLRAVPNLSF
jgi:hypothetical protein